MTPPTVLALALALAPAAPGAPTLSQAVRAQTVPLVVDGRTIDPGALAADALATDGDLVRDVVAADARARLAKKKSKGKAQDEAGLSFIDKHLPLTPPDDLHPVLEDKKVVIWLVSALFGWAGGALWIPALLLDKELTFDDGFQDAQLTQLLVDLVILAIGVPLYVSGSILYGVGVLLTQFLAYAWWAATGFYLRPIAHLHLFNRHVRGTRAKSKKKAGLDAPAPDVTAASLAY